MCVFGVYVVKFRPEPKHLSNKFFRGEKMDLVQNKNTVIEDGEEFDFDDSFEDFYVPPIRTPKRYKKASRHRLAWYLGQ